jgi:hypothetical protein
LVGKYDVAEECFVLKQIIAFNSMGKGTLGIPLKMWDESTGHMA